MTADGATAPGKLKFAIIPVTPLQQNCSLLWDDKSLKGAVVDPGGDLNYVEQVIAEAGMTPEVILLTHGHIDHAGGAAELKERLGVDIIGPHIDDKFLLEGLERQVPQYGIAARNVAPDRWLSDNETIKVAGHDFEVRHCPGHSPGHVVFINHQFKFILIGDVLFRGSIGRTDFPYGNHDALIDAIKTKILPLGDDFAFICGHGPGSTVGVERASNPFIAE